MNVRMCADTHVFGYICVGVCGGQRLTLGALTLCTEAGDLTGAHNSSSLQQAHLGSLPDTTISVFRALGLWEDVQTYLVICSNNIKTMSV